MHRRKYISAVGIAVGAGLAGCSGETGGNNSSSGGNGSDGGSESTEASGGGESTGASGGSEETEISTSGGEDTGTEAGDMRTAGGDTEMPTAMRTPSPTASMSGSGNADVSIDSSEFSQESASGVTDTAVVGELTAPSYLASIELQARFRNDSGDIVDTNSVYFEGLEEGQTWNFYVPSLASEPPAEGEVEVASAIPGSPPSPEGVELLESSLNEPADEYSGPLVTGRAENTSGSPISYLEANVVFLTDDGTALDSDYTNVSDLPGGETWSFELEQLTFSTDPRPDAADHEVTLSTSAL